MEFEDKIARRHIAGIDEAVQLAGRMKDHRRRLHRAFEGGDIAFHQDDRHVVVVGMRVIAEAGFSDREMRMQIVEP